MATKAKLDQIFTEDVKEEARDIAKPEMVIDQKINELHPVVIKDDPQLWDKRAMVASLVATMYPVLLRDKEPRQNMCIDMCLEVADEIWRRTCIKIN
jgi:hypothetical protein